MELKIDFYDCITYYYLGLCSEEQQKWGERITYYQAAVDKLTECTRLYGKGDADSASIGDSLRFAMDVASGK
jgi:tyrosine-protein phosphatase non-receptor type 23